MLAIRRPASCRTLLPNATCTERILSTAKVALVLVLEVLVLVLEVLVLVEEVLVLVLVVTSLLKAGLAPKPHVNSVGRIYTYIHTANI